MTRLLIVDDDVEQTRAVARAFSRLHRDLTVLTAHDGLEATKVLSAGGVDLVLTDLQMPGMDGFALLAWMCNTTPNVPVFAMSGYGTDETSAELRTLGALQYFPKPLDAKAVLARVAEALSASVHGEVHNISLASFLQLLEMERKTCTLTVTCDDKTGTLVVQNGALVSARTAGAEGQQAAITIVAWPFPTIAISRQIPAGPPTIQSPLGFILMEAMRLQDEDARNAGNGESVLPVRRTWRPSSAASQWPPAPTGSNGSSHSELPLPSGAWALAMVATATGEVLRSAARPDCPLTQLAAMASQVLLQEVATLKLCAASEGVEELVLSTSSRCDVIRPVSAQEFALMVFAPEETNLMMARIELEHFIAARSR